jgi:peroxiredoxin
VKKVRFAAPDDEVTLSDGSTKRLGAFWQQRPLALVFPRFFGCPFGRRQILQLCEQQAALRKAGIDVVLVSSGTAEQAEVFRRDYKVPFTVICDPERLLFKKYSLKEMTVRDYLVPRMWAKSFGVMAEGYGHKSGEGSEAQLGGVFIIDTSGTVVHAHIAADAADHPSPADILEAAATLGGKVETPVSPIARAGEPSPQPDAIKSGKGMAFAAYVFFPIPLFAGTCRRNAFVMHHTRQAILPATLNITGVALAIGGAYALSRTSPVTIAGSVLHFAMFALLVVGGIFALRGKTRPLPLLGRFGDSLPFLK